MLSQQGYEVVDGCRQVDDNTDNSITGSTGEKYTVPGCLTGAAECTWLYSLSCIRLA